MKTIFYYALLPLLFLGCQKENIKVQFQICETNPMGFPIVDPLIDTPLQDKQSILLRLDLNQDSLSDIAFSIYSTSSPSQGASRDYKLFLLHDYVKVSTTSVVDTFVQWTNRGEFEGNDCFYYMPIRFSTDILIDSIPETTIEAYETLSKSAEILPASSNTMVDSTHSPLLMFRQYSYYSRDFWRCETTIFEQGLWGPNTTSGYLHFELDDPEDGLLSGFVKIDMSDFFRFKIQEVSCFQ